MKKIDTEKTYSKKEYIKKLRRLADSLEKARSFSIQIKGKKVSVPKNAEISIEHEKERDMEEIEFQIKWKNK